jgi:hypothetical protein
MSYKTLEVELENGHVRPAGPETLPARARALLTLLDSNLRPVAQTCAELAGRWRDLERLAPEEANAFADDLDNARAKLTSPKPAWD